MRNKLCHGWAPACLAVSLVLVCAPALRAERINAILATVDGEPVTLYEVRQFEKKNVRLRQAQPASLAESLQAVITEKILEQEIKQKGIVVRDEDVDAYVQQVKQRNRIDDRQLEEALRQQGLTLEEYRKQVRQDLARQQLIAREIRGKVSVTPEDIDRYLEAHKEEFSGPARIRVAHIFFRLDPEANPAAVAAVLTKAQQVREEVLGCRSALFGGRLGPQRWRPWLVQAGADARRARAGSEPTQGRRAERTHPNSVRRAPVAGSCPRRGREGGP